MEGCDGRATLPGGSPGAGAPDLGNRLRSNLPEGGAFRIRSGGLPRSPSTTAPRAARIGGTAFGPAAVSRLVRSGAPALQGLGVHLRRIRRTARAPGQVLDGPEGWGSAEPRSLPGCSGRIGPEAMARPSPGLPRGGGGGRGSFRPDRSSAGFVRCYFSPCVLLPAERHRIPGHLAGARSGRARIRPRGRRKRPEAGGGGIGYALRPGLSESISRPRGLSGRASAGKRARRGSAGTAPYGRKGGGGSAPGM